MQRGYKIKVALTIRTASTTLYIQVAFFQSTSPNSYSTGIERGTDPSYTVEDDYQ